MSELKQHKPNFAGYAGNAASSNGDAHDEDGDARAKVASMESAHQAVVTRSVGTPKPKKTCKGAKAGKHNAAKAPCKLPNNSIPAMPNWSKISGSVVWRDAKILHSESKNGFRVWFDQHNVAKEKTIKFGSDKKKAWQKVVGEIKAQIH